MRNEKWMEILERNFVNTLPPFKKAVYQYIVDKEESLAQKADSKTQFLSLLKEQLPHQEAATHFKMTLTEVISLMHETEDEISEVLESKAKKYQWIDCTDEVNGNGFKKTGNSQYFLCLS